MSTKLEEAFDEFAAAVEARVLGLAEEVRASRAENQQLRDLVGQLQSRGAPEVEPATPGRDGRDGVGIVSAFLRDGRLVLRTSDDQEHDVGQVVGPPGKDGEDGADGEDGKHADPAVPGKDGKDGQDGADGQDGVGTVEEIEAIVARHVTDLQVRTIADFWQGVYKPGTLYERSAIVQWDGQPWLAVATTSAQPGTTQEWKLLARKGRDGRDRK